MRGDERGREARERGDAGQVRERGGVCLRFLDESWPPHGESDGEAVPESEARGWPVVVVRLDESALWRVLV